MSAPATEIVVCPLKPNSPIEDVSTPAGQLWKDMINTLKNQPGFQRQFWGRQLENENHVVICVDWDSVGSHQTFVSSPAYKEFSSSFASLLDPSSSPSMIHINFEPHPPNAPRAEAPVTEIAFLYLPASASQQQKSDLEAKAENLAKLCMENTDGVSEADRARSIAKGWVVEPMDYPDVEGGKAITFGFMAGWESKEAHLKMTRSQVFAEAVAPIREMVLPNPKEGTGMYHVSFTAA